MPNAGEVSAIVLQFIDALKTAPPCCLRHRRARRVLRKPFVACCASVTSPQQAVEKACRRRMRRLATPKNLGFLGCRTSGLDAARIRGQGPWRAFSTDSWLPSPSPVPLCSSLGRLARPSRQHRAGALRLRQTCQRKSIWQPSFGTLHFPVEAGHHRLWLRVRSSCLTENLRSQFDAS
jgi:hypothetical protein